MDNDNEQLNQDLFDILDSHKQDIRAEKINYELSKAESKKILKAKFTPNDKKAIKIVGLALGTVLVCSGFTNLMKNIDDNNLTENELTIIEQTVSTEQNDIDISNQEKLMDNTNDEKTNVDGINNSKFANKKLFEVGNNKYIDSVYDYMDTSEYHYFERSSFIYGIPSEIMLAIGMQETNLMHDECLPNGEKYNGCALGILQLEQNCNNAVTAYNYISDSRENVKYSDEELCSIEKNIQVGCMRFQHALERYEGNIYVAIQAHNYGETMMDKILELTATDKNIGVSELLTDYQDLSWLKYVQDIHDNPHKYLSDWKYDTYGDSEYLSKVLSYCPTNQVTYQYNGDKINFDLQYGISEIVNNKNK